jgi:glycosyltransferase involved in cell wall biosynthesis
MSEPLVSIIIPCFNAESYVGEAIESALDQTYPVKEVIVIDDGSTDGSLEVIRKFGERVRWESGPNRGGGAARNRGLAIAKGEYIQFLDADDLLDSGKLERQMPVLLETGADVIYSDWRQYEIGSPEKARQCKVGFPSRDAVIIALQKQNIQTNASIIKKEALLRIKGFREDLPCSQERDLYLRLGRSGATFVYLPVVLHSVREVQGHVSGDEVRVREVQRKVLLEVFKDLEQRNELSEERRQAFAELIANGARRLFALGKHEMAKEGFATALRIHPRGGLDGAYGRVGYFMAKVLGPLRAERILGRLKKASAIFTG